MYIWSNNKFMSVFARNPAARANVLYEKCCDGIAWWIPLINAFPTWSNSENWLSDAQVLLATAPRKTVLTDVAHDDGGHGPVGMVHLRAKVRAVLECRQQCLALVVGPFQRKGPRLTRTKRTQAERYRTTSGTQQEKGKQRP